MRIHVHFQEKCEKSGTNSEKELKAMNMRSIHPKEALDIAVSEIQAMPRPGKTLISEVPCRKKDGELLYADINTTRVLFEGKECILSFFRDATQRRKTEEALEKSVIAAIDMVEDIAERKRTEEELQKTKEVAENAKLKLEKINQQLGEANRELQRLTFIDGLTGIANRRHFDQVLDREWRRALRGQKPLSLILSDIDFFKNYNDHYGHLEGDDCLRRVAKALTKVARRPGDLVARYGGEEFEVILPDTDSENASKLAEKARTAVLSLEIPHGSSEVSDYVSISLGVASSNPDSDLSSHKLIEAADKSLYSAKLKGRNQVIIFTQ